MNIYHLYETQFDELKERLSFTYSAEDLEAIGANTDDWSADDWSNWSNDTITDIMTIKAFDGYDFTCDDFSSTAGLYEYYPETDDIINGNFRIALLPIARFITSDGENFTDENAAIDHQKAIDFNSGAKIPNGYICGGIARLAKDNIKSNFGKYHASENFYLIHKSGDEITLCSWIEENQNGGTDYRICDGGFILTTDIADAFNTPEYENTTLYYTWEYWSDVLTEYKHTNIIKALTAGVDIDGIIETDNRGSLQTLKALTDGYYLIFWR